MKSKFLLSACLIAGFLGADAQQRVTYAITGDGNHDFVWMNIRKVDLQTGQVTGTVFDRARSSYSLTDVLTRRVNSQQGTATLNIFDAAEYPTGTFVAAAAFDQRSNKLFFTPMRRGELRWLDLNDNSGNSFYTMTIPGFKTNDPNDEATNITRMVIGADGMGYALSNDGNHFFSFTTGKKPVVRHLGNLIDDASSSSVSIHNKCTSWGGDMIADAFGKLYVISANHAVFTIDPATRIATYMGQIQGLPAGYTTNAAAVNDQGEVVVASANLFEGYYSFSISDLKAVKMEGSDTRYNASDFANANLLFQKEAASLLNSKLVPAPAPAPDARVFPNPVSGNRFNVLFEGQPAGRYTIVLSDLAGRNLNMKTISVATGRQVESVNLNNGLAKGVYLVKVLNENKEAVITEKVVVQ